MSTQTNTVLRGTLPATAAGTGLRFRLDYQGDAAQVDDLGLAYLRIYNPSGALVFDLQPTVVMGVGRDGTRASGRFDDGLLLNAGIVGSNLSEAPARYTILSDNALVIGGGALDRLLTGVAYTVEAGVLERNDSDSSTSVSLSFLTDATPAVQLARVFTSGAAEANPDWQAIGAQVMVDSTPPIISVANQPIGTGVLRIDLGEATTAVRDFDANEPVSWSLSGDDAGLFSIDPEGRLQFKAAPDWEQPADQNRDNAYNVVLRATDQAGNATQTPLDIRISDVDEQAPTLLIGGSRLGSQPFELSHPENLLPVVDLDADEAVVWGLSGEDAGLFEIDADGQLRFKAGPDFEHPTDKDRNNIYSLTVFASDQQGNRTDRALAIAVANGADEGITTPSVLKVASEGSGLYLEPGLVNGQPATDPVWLDLSMLASQFIDGNSWVGLRVETAAGQSRSLGALGQAFDDRGQPLLEGVSKVALRPGETLYFDWLNPPQDGSRAAAAVTISQPAGSTGFAITLDRGGADTDPADDITLQLQAVPAPDTAWSRASASLQQGSADAIVDLREPSGPDGLIRLKVDLFGDSGNVNRIGLVRLDTDANGAVLGSVGGVLSSSGGSFREAVRNNLVGFDGSQPIAVGGGRFATTLDWTVDPAERGVYALVMIAQTGEVFTFGTTTASDNRSHVRMIGANTFGFEDLTAAQNGDFDYNDAVVRIRPA